MSNAVEETDQKAPDVPVASPIILGITGHRHLPENYKELDQLRMALQVTFRAFSAEKLKKESNSELTRRVLELRKKLGFPVEMLYGGLPKDTPVWLLSPMAEGADMLAAVEAHRFYVGDPDRNDVTEKRLAPKEERQFRIVVSLTAPADYKVGQEDPAADTPEGYKYPIGSPYRWKHRPEDVNDSKAGPIIAAVSKTLERIRGKLPPGDPENEDYTEFLLPIGGRATLRRHTTYPSNYNECPIKPFREWDTGHFAPLDLDNVKSEDVAQFLSDEHRKQEHFRTGANYVALYCHVLVALWDGHLRVDSVGSDAAVRINIAGPETAHLSHGPIFNWADAGPVVQILTNNLNPSRSGLESGDKTETPQLIRGRLTVKGSAPGEIAVIHPADCAHAAEKPVETAGEKSKGERLISKIERCFKWVAERLFGAGHKDEKDFDQREKHGRDIFARVLKATSEFNRDLRSVRTKSGTPDGYIPLTFRVPDAKPDEVPEDTPPLDRFAKESGFDSKDPVDRKLQHLSILGNRADGLAIKLKEDAVRYFSILFFLVAGAAVAFDLYAHWYKKLNSDGHPDHHFYLLVIFAVFAVAAVACYHFLLRRPHTEGRYLEYRALAEACRIQLAWLGSGIPQSVALHYLQRHRGSFDWIRDTVSAWSFPYEDGQRRFDRLPDDAKRLARLRYVSVGWIKDQLKYFNGDPKAKKGGAAQRESSLQHTHHLMGVATALVGIAAAGILLFQSVPCSCGLGSPWDGLLTGLVFLLGPALAVIVLFQMLTGHHQSGGADPEQGRWRFCTVVILIALSPIITGLLSGGSELEHPPVAPFLFGWIITVVTLTLGILFILFAFFYDRLLKTRIPGWLSKRIDKPERTVLPFVPFAISLFAYVAFGLGHFVVGSDGDSSHQSSVFTESTAIASASSTESAMEFPNPSAFSLVSGGEGKPGKTGLPYILLIGLPILWGALLIAWGEKQLFSEHANRYFTAGELFRLTDRRLDAVLAKAENSLANGDTDGHIREAQDILFELGKEALSENAEWLLLHRARPLEFPLAG